MNQEKEILEMLDNLRRTPKETEVLEFKEAKAQYDFTKLCRYFSALSNEANLQNKAVAWMILGVQDAMEDGIRPIVGTNWRIGTHHALKQEVAQKTSGGFTFRNIYEVTVDNQRVLMFEIPACENGIPVASEGQYYGRNGESLVPLSLDKIEAIRRKNSDWSREIVPDATIKDLDEAAIKIAREQFINHDQKKRKTKYLLNQLKDDNYVELDGKTRAAVWRLNDSKRQ